MSFLLARKDTNNFNTLRFIKGKKNFLGYVILAAIPLHGFCPTVPGVIARNEAILLVMLAKAHRGRLIHRPPPSLWKRRVGICGWVIRNPLAGCTIGDTKSAVLFCSRLIDCHDLITLPALRSRNDAFWGGSSFLLQLAMSHRERPIRRPFRHCERRRRSLPRAKRGGGNL